MRQRESHLVQLTIMQGPGIAPIVELGRQLDRVEARRYIRNDPEDQPHGRPRLPDQHCHILAREAQRNHAHEINHPVYHKCAFAERVGVFGNLGRCSGRIRERNLESKRNQRIGKRHETVGNNGGRPAPYDELPEFQRRVACRDEKFHVDWQIEGEREKGNDDQVNEPDRDCRRHDRGRKRAQAVLRKTDCWIDGLRRALEVGQGDAIILENHGCPHGAERGSNFGLETV